MLVISTYIERSQIDNLGLFAGQDIKEGELINSKTSEIKEW